MQRCQEVQMTLDWEHSLFLGGFSGSVLGSLPVACRDSDKGVIAFGTVQALHLVGDAHTTPAS
jgi:hypothetical protein